jgi:hypothetical protein
MLSKMATSSKVHTGLPSLRGIGDWIGTLSPSLSFN